MVHHCPISKANAERHRSLLLQFLLWDMMHAQPNRDVLFGSTQLLFPFDWSIKTGQVPKIQQHVSLLRFAFPQLIGESKEMEKRARKLGKPVKKLEEQLRSLWSQLTPFVQQCTECDKLASFLLRHEKKLSRFFV